MSFPRSMTDASVSSVMPRSRAASRARAESHSSWWVVTSARWPMTMILPSEGGVRRRLDRDLQVVDVHHEQARSGLLDHRGQVFRRGTGLEWDGHRAGADAGQIHHGVFGARGTDDGDEVARFQGMFGMVAPLGGHSTDPFPEFAVDERVEPLQEAQRGAARVRVGDRLRGTLAEGGTIRVPLHHRGHQGDERRSGPPDRLGDGVQGRGVRELGVGRVQMDASSAGTCVELVG
ncbi:hypothetical protein GA0115234_101656 [Streptomyces sp. DvalAA-43]|nr:hypothetical protein GA0115234_101656 [Streptomyces sp. DvalAA-43]